LIACYQRL